MPFRLKPSFLEKTSGRELSSGALPSLFGCRGIAPFALAWLFIWALSILNTSCVSVFSSRSDALPSADSGASGGLIKPKLQDRDITARPTSENNIKVTPLHPTAASSKDQAPAFLNRLFSFLQYANTSKGAGGTPALIKPKLSEPKEKEAAPEKLLREFARSGPSPEDASSAVAASQGKNGSPDSSPSKSKRRGTLQSPRQEGAATASGDRTPAPGGSAQSRPEDDKGTTRDQKPAEGQEMQTTFKRHDHAKYVTMMRNKAIDTLNKEPDCDLARLCRDSFTDNWSLTLYMKSGKYYSYIVYAWDEIDANWVISYTSEKRPLATMKKHLSFSSAGKTCQTLKGSEHAESF